MLNSDWDLASKKNIKIFYYEKTTFIATHNINFN